MHTCFSSTHFLRVPVFSHQQVILRRQVIQGFMGTLWMEDPRDEAEFAPGHVFFSSVMLSMHYQPFLKNP